MENSEQPAFPPSSEYIRKLNEGYYEPSGMTKREYFAAMAMQGMLAADNYAGTSEWKERISADSVKIADELLKQLENQQP